MPRGLGMSGRRTASPRVQQAHTSWLGLPGIVALAVLALLASAAVAQRPVSKSGSNGRIAFVLSSSATGRCANAAGDLATANPDGTDCQVLSRVGGVAAPAWNSTSQTIAFTRMQDGLSAIYLINADGTDERPLGATSAQAYDPSWSPDGSRIAFTGDQTGTPQIYVADSSTGALLAQLTNGAPANSEPAWSPDGARIAFVSNRDGLDHVYVMQAGGADQRIVTSDSSNELDPTWSPDGSRLAFARGRLGQGSSQVYTVYANGTGESRVTDDPLSDRSPSWSPDGRLISFTQSNGGTTRVRLVAAPGDHAQPPSRLSGIRGQQGSWGRLSAPSVPIPGVSVIARPKGSVQVSPNGSTLAEPLNGAASVSVAPDAPSIFSPAPGASVQLTTRLSNGKSAVITISQGKVAVSQPRGAYTRIVLVGEAAQKCPVASHATVDRAGRRPHWHVRSHGNGHPTLVHGTVTLGLHGTVLSVMDNCRGPHGLRIKVISGSVSIGQTAPSHRTKVLMVLAGSLHGRFHTKGRESAATVRG
jgi:Tol biopolymer transport system component